MEEKMVREFNLINEKKETYSLMDIQNYCLLTDPNGLGYAYNTEYERLGDVFISVLRQIEQGKISGTVNFISYDNFRNFVNFIESSEDLKFSYKIPFKNEIVEFFRDIQIQTISKTQLQSNGILSENIVIDCLSLWYQNKETVYDVEDLGGEEMQWDFVWDTRFSDYRSRSIVFENDGHVEAPLKIEIDGYLIKPEIIIRVNGATIADLPFNFTLTQGEKIFYSSVDNEIYITKQNTDGTITNLFQHQYIDLKNNNIFKVPKGTSEITLTADNNILNAKINIYKQYKVV